MLAFNRFSTWSMIVVVLWLIGLLTVLGGIPSGAEPAGKASNDDVPTQAARQQAGANTNAHEDTCRASGSKEVAGAKESQAVEHFTLSNFYFSHWHLALAEVELEEAIAHWPDFKLAHRNLCLVSLFRGNFAR
ncbi:MAG: hypothetical protein HY711_09480, partial [Candidatus Melainabacteria bacterium]|nr:hypothetical protein [Candidatus Melainabacteria bacterium]